MEDKKIVQLYWDRNQEALTATEKKYGKYCTSIARNILDSKEDAEECVNDTYWKAWNTMPPQRPNILSAFLGKITRNLSFDRFRRNSADKRGGGQMPVVLDELKECVSGSDDVAKEMDRRELVATINAFLKTLSAEKRNMFICRYWYFDSVTDIATRFKMSENNVSVTLNRLRTKLRSYLLERGYEV